MQSVTITYMSMIRLGSIAACIGIASLVGQASVQAQSKADKSNARKAYAEGKAKFDAGDFAGAEAAFQSAYGFVQNPVVLLGIAKSQEAQGNLRGAAESLESYMSSSPEATSMDEHKQHVDRLRGAPGKVSIEGTKDAVVKVDGSTQGTVPVTLELSGEHTITVESMGYETFNKDINVEFAEPVVVEANLAQAAVVEEDQVDEGVEEQEENTITDSTEEEDSGGIGAGVWVASGLAAASLIAGTVLGFQALSLQADFDEMPTEATADKGERFALIADILFGVAAVSAITAIVLFITSKKKPTSDDADSLAFTLNPVVAPNGGGLTAALTF